MNLTTHLLYSKWRYPGDEPKLHLFGQLKRIVRQWLETCLVCKGDTYPAHADVPAARGSSHASASIAGINAASGEDR